MTKWYLACPYLIAKHKCQGTSEVQEKTRDKDIKRFRYHSYAKINRVPGQTHYTKNDSSALKKVLKELMETQHKNKRKALRRGKQGLIMC